MLDRLTLAIFFRQVSSEKCVFVSRPMKIVTFLRKNAYHPKRVVDFPRERDTFRNKIMEIVEDFNEKSYNNNGKPWKSSRILRVNPCFSFFLSFFIIFLHFFFSFFIFHLLVFSFFIIFSFFIFLHFPSFSSIFLPSCSFKFPSCFLHVSFIFLHFSFIFPSLFLHCSFIFLHFSFIFPSLFLHFSFIFPSCFLHFSFMFPSCSLHVPSCSLMFLHVLHCSSCSFIFFHVLCLCWVLKI